MTSQVEIWSSRLQRELFALTTDNEESRKDVGILPPFLSVKEHHLDINHGKCNVSFAVMVENLADKKDRKNDSTEASEETKNSNEDNKGPNSLEVIITLDASLHYNVGSNTPNTSLSYPFYKPKAILTSGAEHLPESTGISNGSNIQIDCDWTPSLHLNDAALNIALKVRESVKRGEACFKLEYDQATSKEDTFDSKVGSFFSSFKNRANAIVEDMDNKIDNANREKPRVVNRRKKEKKTTGVKIVTEQNIEIGDVIDLSKQPWNAAVGMYPCRALRRPAFAEAAMKASQERDNKPKVAGTGFNAAGSMFKSFSSSAKSVFEESFIMFTRDLILEIKCSKFSVSNATVTFAIPVSHLAKLKFRREESISLFFKQSPDDPLIYMCPSSADAVKQIQAILKQHGVKGKHTNATMIKTVQYAMQILTDVKSKEKIFEEHPGPELVAEIMDLYREAAEKFEMAGDRRHEEVMTHMKDFLAKSHVSNVLDNMNTKAQQASVAEGKNLESKAQYDNKIDVAQEQGKATEKKDEELENAMKAAEDMLNSAHEELKDMGVDDSDCVDDVDFDKDVHDKKSSSEVSSSDQDVVSEFEDMLADADKELAELMDS
mmetsp:Transcript_4156/g.5432  ORF Transcript_4156/g.5432 Transcript_4156/m.5432 type:complete len:604 (+) Transcript_4156:71-1882(+)